VTAVHSFEHPVIERLDPDLDPEGDLLVEFLPVDDDLFRQAVRSGADHKAVYRGVAESLLPVRSEGREGSIG
jgi:hypothetical protein